MKMKNKRAKDLGLCFLTNDCLQCENCIKTDAVFTCEETGADLSALKDNADISPCVDSSRMKNEMTDAEYDAYRHNRLEIESDIYIWKDIVSINGSISAEEFPISGDMDDEMHYDISDFLYAVAAKYGVDSDDVETYVMDDIDFDPTTVPYGAEACGCYINGVAEWLLDE
jgi:hypothetical protein